MNRLADQLLPPERRGYVGKVGHQANENFAADFGDFQPRDRPYGMIHAIENEEVEVAKIAGDGEVDNLPASIFERAIVAPPTFKDQVKRAWRVTFANELSPRLNRMRRLFRNALQFGAVRLGESGKLFEAPDQGHGQAL